MSFAVQAGAQATGPAGQPTGSVSCRSGPHRPVQLLVSASVHCMSFTAHWLQSAAAQGHGICLSSGSTAVRLTGRSGQPQGLTVLGSILFTVFTFLFIRNAPVIRAALMSRLQLSYTGCLSLPKAWPSRRMQPL